MRCKTTTTTSVRGRLAALMAVLALLAAACGGGAAQQGEAGVAAGGGETPQDGETADLGTAAGDDEGDSPTFDLSGVEFTATTSAPGALNMGTFWAFEKLQEWGASIDLVILTTTTGIQALIADRSNVASHGSDEVVLGAAEGADVVAIGSPSTKMDYVLVARKGTERVEDLQGKTIAMSGPAGFDALLSRFALQDVGLDPDSDVRFVQVGGSPERATALLSGNVDAATIFLEDWEELRLQSDELTLVQYMAELVPEFPASVYFGKRQFWQDNPELATALACANLEANAWMNADKEGFVEYTLDKVEGASPEATEAIYAAAQEIDMWPSEPDEILSVEGLDGLIEAMVETGDISEPVDPDSIVDTSYLQEAHETGCGA
ncbi:MAG: ABC transporter substrate-binding protein [Egibacteraceae bacterium]